MSSLTMDVPGNAISGTVVFVSIKLFLAYVCHPLTVWDMIYVDSNMSPIILLAYESDIAFPGTSIQCFALADYY